VRPPAQRGSRPGWDRRLAACENRTRLGRDEAMIATLALWLYVSLLCWLVGWLGLRAFDRAPARPHSGPPFALAALLGLAWLSALTCLLALATRVGLLANALLLGAALALALPNRRALAAAWSDYGARARRLAWPVWLALLVGALITLERTASPATNYDTGLYHAQAIRWLEEFGIVPGLGNLHGRLGFSAAWFVPSALFSLAFLGLRSFHVLGGAIFLLLLLATLPALQEWWDGKRRASVLVKAATAPLGLFLFGGWLSSPSPDVPAAILVWLVAILFLEKIEDRTLQAIDARAVAIVSLGAFALAVKLSTLPIALLPLVLLAPRAVRQPRPALLVAALGIATLVPFVAQTAVTSGYLVYPYPRLDLLAVDWKVPAALARDDLRWAESWARLPHRAPDEVLALPLAVWVPAWFARFPPLEKGLLLAGLALLPPYAVAAAAALRAGGASARAAAPRLALAGAVALGVVFWFVAAPDARFGWGFLALLPLLLATSTLPWLLRRLPAPAPTVLALALVGAYAVQTYVAAPPDVAAYALLPADYPVPPTVTRQGRGFQALAPATRDQCFYQPFPCTPSPVERVELRGPTLAQGFRAHGA